MKTILFVHQSAELYGSDKVLFSLVTGLDRQRFRAIVVLPAEGALTDALRAKGIAVHVVPLVRLGRATWSLGGLLRLPRETFRSLRAINAALCNRSVTIVHSNTLAVLSGALWAKWQRIPHVWHVHEMIVHPKIVRVFFPWLLRLLSERVPCNSHATRQLLLESQPRLAAKSLTIWNGLDRDVSPVDESVKANFRRKLGLKPDDVLVLLMGRINRWKGQTLLVDAAAQLRQTGLNNVHFLIVGSVPPGQGHFLTELQKKILWNKSSEYITIMDFQQDIWPLWDACDIAVVPSTEPEPFGMVALEAMAAQKPVIAAGHGGLLDIVIDGVTGLLITPNDATSLATAIISLAQDGAKRNQMGLNGRVRLQEVFSLQRYVSSFEQLYESEIGKDSYA